MKYPQRARLCFGVAAVRLIVEKTEEGRSCTPFDYTGKTVVMILDSEQLIEKESRRVKNLKCGGSGWVNSMREPGEYWDDELLSSLSIHRFGKKTMGKLKCVNILTVGQIKEQNNQSVSSDCKQQSKWNEDKKHLPTSKACCRMRRKDIFQSELLWFIESMLIHMNPDMERPGKQK
jgi:hypothetical protein